MKQKVPPHIVRAIKLVKNKRAKIVLDHIKKHGSITSEELTNQYGYGHPPRAVKDASDLGFPIERFSVKSKEGRSIAAYRFGDLSEFGEIKSARRMLPKTFKAKLIEMFGAKCNICSGKFEARYLQIDHRVPFGVHGEVEGDLALVDFQLLCGSCNRAKSWSCEHCENLLSIKNPNVCVTCYWGHPEEYEHVAMEDARRLDLLWQGQEVKDFDAMRNVASKEGIELPKYVKRALKARSE
ncbi:MAG TPA: HNH endonuclease [Candidatus Kapabacteria bacterium]|nr:HNH endonuclease [Candidatus Kapabacteria bacterium]